MHQPAEAPEAVSGAAEYLARGRGIAAKTAALAAAAERELGRAVPFDWLCVGITDPSSGLVTMAQDCTPVGPPEVYIATEFLVPDVNRIAWLAGQPDPVGVLSRATNGDLASSYRYRNALAPSGIEHELRAALRADGACWGYLVLLRGPDRQDFSGAEIRRVRAAIPALAAGLRSSLLAGPGTGQPGPTGTDAGPPGPTGPAETGVAVIGEDGTVQAANARAREVFAQLAAAHPAVPLNLPVPVAVVVAGMRDPDAPGCRRVLLSGPDDTWLVLEANRVSAEEGGSRVVVSVAPAGPLALAPLILQERGLTEREIAVAQCVLRGMSTAEIAGRLYISEYTVQDHLKSAFAKTGHRNRREFARSILSADDLGDLM
jgi:DNA-binding CsgD family transcriptional regulator